MIKGSIDSTIDIRGPSWARDIDPNGPLKEIILTCFILIIIILFHLADSDHSPCKEHMVLACSPTTITDKGRELPGLFIYDRNDPSGQKLDGLFFLGNKELRRLSDNDLHYKGYIKQDVTLHERSPHFPRYPFFWHIGGDFVIRRSRLIELRRHNHVWNGDYFIPLVSSDFTEWVRHNKFKYDKQHIYIRSWADKAEKI